MGSGQVVRGVRGRAQQKSLPTESSHPPARPAATSMELRTGDAGTMEPRTNELNSPRLARLASRPGMLLNANSHPTSSSQSAVLPTASTCAA